MTLTEQVVAAARVEPQVVETNEKPVPVTEAVPGTVMVSGKAPVLVNVETRVAAAVGATKPKSMFDKVPNCVGPVPAVSDAPGAAPAVVTILLRLLEDTLRCVVCCSRPRIQESPLVRFGK